jgi:hypothetical protein
VPRELLAAGKRFRYHIWRSRSTAAHYSVLLQRLILLCFFGTKAKSIQVKVVSSGLLLRPELFPFWLQL